jgi:REP element-mobilizing transposase RayT
MPYDPFKHHRRSIRLKGYDYAQAGAYFVTICAQNRECLFGEIAAGEMHLNAAGEMIVRWWNELSNKFPTFEPDAFVVMPNHIHCIIVIHDGEATALGQPKPTLGDIIEWFKTMATNEYIRGVKQLGWKPFPKRVFQRNYYEHIIRNERELTAIRKYIENNPAKWTGDGDNLQNSRHVPAPQTVDDYLQDAKLDRK